MAVSYTAEQETAQAFFCAIADYLGHTDSLKWLDTKTYPTYDAFCEGWARRADKKTLESLYGQRVKSNISFSRVNAFLRLEAQQKWYVSSVRIALKLITDLSKLNSKFQPIENVGCHDVYYHRGDDDVMKTVENLFKSVNANQKAFNNVNKWNPADIYYASTQGKNTLKKCLQAATTPRGFKTFDQLNEMMLELYQTGHLLPLSLKFAFNNVVLETANAFRPSDVPKPQYRYHGNRFAEAEVENETYHESVTTRSLEIFASLDKVKFITIRMSPSFPLGKEQSVDLKVIAQTRGQRYLEGSLSMTTLADVVNDIMPGVGNMLKTEYKQLVTDYANNLKNTHSLDDRDKQENRNVIRDLVYTKVGKIMLSRIQDLFVSNDTKDPTTKLSAADNLVHHIYTFAKSQSAKSSGFVIARGE